MCLKIRRDEKSEKFCKIFWELNKALILLSSRVMDGWQPCQDSQHLISLILIPNNRCTGS